MREENAELDNSWFLTPPLLLPQGWLCAGLNPRAGAHPFRAGGDDLVPVPEGGQDLSPALLAICKSGSSSHPMVWAGSAVTEGATFQGDLCALRWVAGTRGAALARTGGLLQGQDTLWRGARLYP